MQCEKSPFTKIDEGQNRLNRRSGEVTFSACRVESEGGCLADSLQEHHFRGASDASFEGITRSRIGFVRGLTSGDWSVWVCLPHSVR